MANDQTEDGMRCFCFCFCFWTSDVLGSEGVAEFKSVGPCEIERCAVIAEVVWCTQSVRRGKKLLYRGGMTD